MAFWTDDPYFRLRPEVANPSALSARLLKNPTEGQVPTSQTYPQCLQFGRVLVADRGGQLLNSTEAYLV